MSHRLSPSLNALLLTLAGCLPDETPCFTNDSNCEGNTLVECVGSRGNPGSIQIGRAHV